MSRSKETLGITVLTVLTIALPALGGYRDYSQAINISGGEDHTLVLTNDKNAWACGPNGGYAFGEYYYGVLGSGSNNWADVQRTLVGVRGPNDVGFLGGIIAADAGWMHSLALDVNGFVWSWGWNSEGQCGNGESGNFVKDCACFYGWICYNN